MAKSRLKNPENKKTKKKSPQAPTPNSTVPSPELDAYTVARAAWEDGLTRSELLGVLKLDKSPADYNRVKRALQRAIKERILILQPKAEDQLRDSIKQLYPNITFKNLYVARDRLATCLQAARVINDTICRILETSSATRTRCYIAVAGGRTLCDVVSMLETEVAFPLPSKHCNLCFVSLNASEHQSRFNECANYLAVRMSQIYHASHMAVVGHLNSEDKAYQDIVEEKLDLVICGVGGSGESGFLATVLERHKLSLPSDVVGDLGFWPITSRGTQSKAIGEDVAAFITNRLAVAPGLDNLRTYASQNKLIAILSGDDKVKVGHTILDKGLGCNCIMDAQIAKGIVHLRRRELESGGESG